MINRERVIKEFIELVKIDSLTLCERKMADTLKTKLINMGFSPQEDDTGSKIGGNSGNIICKVDGNKNIPGIVLMAHMDTVVLGINKTPVIEGDIIKTDGTTILGGDDVAGIETILESVRVIKERNLDHGNVYIVFTVAEEGGLLGAKNLQIENINALYGFVMDDGGPIGHVAVCAPSQNKINIKVTGKAAHAGVEPENGINAIQIASKAISQMKLGRIDQETTSNIGIIRGGEATNIVCDTVNINAEARSRDINKLENQTRHMEECFINAAKEWGGQVIFESSLEYPSFFIDKNEDIIDILKEASLKAGIDLVLEATGGGSDTNIINSKGIRAVDISVGMTNVHSTKEQININDLVKACEFLVNIITSVK